MRKNGTPQGIGEYEANRRQKKKWLTVVTCLAAVVVFCTAYLLTMPAVTMEIPGPYCGETAHQHISSCYDENGELICGLTEHTHTLACYSDSSADVETASDWEVLDKNGNDINTQEVGVGDDLIYRITWLQDEVDDENVNTITITDNIPEGTVFKSVNTEDGNYTYYRKVYNYFDYEKGYTVSAYADISVTLLDKDGNKVDPDDDDYNPKDVATVMWVIKTDNLIQYRAYGTVEFTVTVTADAVDTTVENIAKVKVEDNEEKETNKVSNPVTDNFNLVIEKVSNEYTDTKLTGAEFYLYPESVKLGSAKSGETLVNQWSRPGAAPICLSPLGCH